MKTGDKKSNYKDEILKHLSSTNFMDPKHSNFFHGRIYRNSNPPAPEITWESSDPPRCDHGAPDWLTATEYTDTESVFQDKVEWLMALLKISSKTVVYTGAGISTAAGVEQAARGGQKSVGCSTDAQPTITHCVIAALREKGLIHSWIQQNHDGLPQKAGYPQEDIVEIHGSWYDPSNPVVCYDGNLKDGQHQKMKEAADSADLVLVLGTSLSGLNSDRVAKDPARRSLHGNSLGTVIINLQQTQQDGISTLRIFAQTDQVFSSLLEKLKLPLVPIPKFSPVTKALIPYDKNGKRSQTKKMYLDLSNNQKVKLNPDHNCQGAKQPGYLHIGSDKAITHRGIKRQPGPGHGRVVRYSHSQCGWLLEVEGVSMLLGGWWLDAAAKGEVEYVPVINMEPQVVGM
eukprot:GFUD01040158.1.p1 GENE.GFUD01040158.1~~GFUD01040158.1.p1  ORF type:complete len:401 (-),score=89.89 GFUD01040158.1:44-1246(-)